MRDKAVRRASFDYWCFESFKIVHRLENFIDSEDYKKLTNEEQLLIATLRNYINDCNTILTKLFMERWGRE